MRKHFRHYFALYPLAIESLNLKEFDLILSSSSGYAKGVRKRRGATHICYCHTPMRWVWRYEDYAAREHFRTIKRKVLPLALSALRRWDLRAAEQPDFYIANSKTTARNIKKVYGREAMVIPPPIDVNRFSAYEPDEDYYLILSRMVAYKHLDLAIEACKKLNRRLVVIGDGPDRKRLESLAGKETEFLGHQPDEVVAKYASGCRALLFPGEEDFGMVPLEINSAGRPVICYGAGGATETVIESETGIFFKQQSTASLIEAIEKFETVVWNRRKIRQHAEKFDTGIFVKRIQEFLHEVAPASCRSEKFESKARSPFSSPEFITRQGNKIVKA